MPISSPDKTPHGAACFLISTVIIQSPHQIDCAYSDDDTEVKGIDGNTSITACRQHRICQKFTQVNRPQTNDKTERVIHTLMDMWHSQIAL